MFLKKQNGIFFELHLLLFPGSFVHFMRLLRFVSNFFFFFYFDRNCDFAFHSWLLSLHWSKFSDGQYFVSFKFSVRLDAFNWKKNPNGFFSLAYIAFGYHKDYSHNDANAKQSILNKKQIFIGNFAILSGRRWRPSKMKNMAKRKRKIRNNAIPLQCVCVQCALNWQALPFNKCYPYR